MAHSRTWDAAYEAIPANTEQAKLGAQRIRELKVDVKERLALDHSMAGNDDDGKHKQVTFLDPLGVDPTPLTNEGYLYTKDIAGVPELFFEDELGNVLQMTTGGTLNPNGIRNATNAQDGVIEIATDAEAQAKASGSLALCPSNLAALGASQTFAGLVEQSTNAEAATRTDTARYITPANLGYVINGDTPPAGNHAGHYVIYPEFQHGAGTYEPIIQVHTGLTEYTWQTIGPTGSGATMETSQMDNIPANCIGLLVQGWCALRDSSGTNWRTNIKLGVSDGNTVPSGLPGSSNNLVDQIQYVPSSYVIYRNGRQAFVLLNTSTNVIYGYWGSDATSLEQFWLLIVGYVCQWPTS